MKDGESQRIVMQEYSKKFPWTQKFVQDDGTFNVPAYLFMHKHFGKGKSFGWWTRSEPGDVNEWGSTLLDTTHIADRKGWNLPDTQIPWLDFSTKGSTAPPQSPPSFEHNWASYYEWRGIHVDSPACLLLHWPLTVYRLLYILGLVPMGTPKKRRRLIIHLVGIERELDILPLYGELALLLPNTDLDIIFFGPGVTGILQRAKGQPRCLASAKNPYEYTAPPVSGGGTVKISLSNEGPFWGAHRHRSRYPTPDALIACNAGLGAYPNWYDVTLASITRDIPFAITDYREISLQINAKLVLNDNLMEARQTFWQHIKLTPTEEKRLQNRLHAKYSYKIGVNPFGRLGPQSRHDNIPGPYAVNGFEMVVTPVNLAHK